MSYYFRKINQIPEADKLKILNMRNNPKVSERMENQNFISWQQHLKFIEETTKDIYVFYFQATPLGTFEINHYLNDFGMMIDPYNQSRGFGNLMMETFLKDYPGISLKSKVKRDNKSAIAIYKKFGFGFSDLDGGHYRIELKR